MRKLILLVACLVLSWTQAEAANLATITPAAPTVTPAASPSPKAAQRRELQAPNVGGIVWERANIAEGGEQIGSTASGASLLTFVKVGKCTIDLPAIAVVATPIVGPPNTTKAWCTATGAAVGDTVLATLENYDNSEYAGLRLHAAKVIAADQIELIFAHGSLAGLDPAVLTVRYVVIR